MTFNEMEEMTHYGTDNPSKNLFLMRQKTARNLQKPKIL